MIISLSIRSRKSQLIRVFFIANNWIKEFSIILHILAKNLPNTYANVSFICHLNWRNYFSDKFSCSSCWSFLNLMDNSVNGGQWNVPISFRFSLTVKYKVIIKWGNLFLLGEWKLLTSFGRGPSSLKETY